MIDSVTRQWLEHARKAGQQPGPGAADGTFAAGVLHVTELLPSFMNDIINAAPEDQKVRFLDASSNDSGSFSTVVEALDSPVLHCGFLQEELFLSFTSRDVDSRNLRVIGENQETRRHLGAWKYLSANHTC